MPPTAAPMPVPFAEANYEVNVFVGTSLLDAVGANAIHAASADFQVPRATPDAAGQAAALVTNINTPGAAAKLNKVTRFTADVVNNGTLDFVGPVPLQWQLWALDGTEPLLVLDSDLKPIKSGKKTKGSVAMTLSAPGTYALFACATKAVPPSDPGCLRSIVVAQ